MFAIMRRRGWRVVAGIVAFVLIGGASGTAWLNQRLTRYVESGRFRAELEKETSKGPHFPDGHYEPIKRTGTWTAESPGFQANNGRKALKSLKARGFLSFAGVSRICNAAATPLSSSTEWV